MSQSTLIRVTPQLFINWFTITFVEVVMLTSTTGDEIPVVRVGTSEGFRDIPMDAGGDRLLSHLHSISEDLTCPLPEVDKVPPTDEHMRSFADRFVRHQG